MAQMMATVICLSWLFGPKTTGALPYLNPSTDPEDASGLTAAQGKPVGQHPSSSQIHPLAHCRTLEVRSFGA